MKKIGPIVPLFTPCSRSGKLDLDGLRAECKDLLEAGYKGFFVAGTCGRGPWFSRADREKICQTAAVQIDRAVTLIAGVTSPGLTDMLENAHIMADAGAQIAVATVPGYFKYNPKEIETIFMKFADASPIPVMVYDIPEFTNTKLDQETILRLAQHGNIIGFKDSSTDFERFKGLAFALEQNPDFLLFQGKEDLISDSLRLGASGFILGLIHLAPTSFMALYHAIGSGDLKLAASLQAEVNQAYHLFHDATERRPESSTFFHMLNYAIHTRRICKNILFNHDSKSPVWLNEMARQAVEAFQTKID